METNNNTSKNNFDNAQAASQNSSVQATTSEAQAANETPNNTQSLEDLQRQIQELRAENAKHRRKTKEQEDAVHAAAEQRLKEQGEYKQLAEQHEARVKALEPLQGRYEQLSTLIASQLEAQIKDWPAEVKAFDPGEDAPIEQRLAWVEKGKSLVDRLQQQARSQQPGNAPNPKPQQAPSDIATTYTNRLRASGKYGA